MSMAIARAKYTGDPGFFDFLKKAATIGTSFIPFVGPTISQAIARTGAGPGSVPISSNVGCPPGAWKDSQGRCRTDSGSGPMQVVGAARNGAVFPKFIVDPSAAGPGGAPLFSRMPAPAMAMNGASAGGYHLNKSDYFLKSGEYIPAGTRWVKNRKRNPANARATSRAISRISGAKTYAKSLGRISIRKKC